MTVMGAFSDVAGRTALVSTVERVREVVVSELVEGVVGAFVTVELSPFLQRLVLALRY